MAKEIELKLALPPRARERLLAHPLIASAPRAEPPALLINTYFDTPDFALRAARVAVRTRQIGERWLQTVKCAAPSAGGLSSRPEWEQPYDGKFDFTAVDDEFARGLLDAHANEIVPVFTTNFERDTRLAEPRAGVRILVMIDNGRIEAADREQAISEVELELAEGSAEDLFEFALQLASALPLLPEDASKAQRGFDLFLGTEPQVVRSGHVTIDPKTEPVAAFKLLAYDCLSAWQANIALARSQDDDAFIHQARVAMRRLRSLIHAFEEVLDEDFATHWEELLSELAGRLGLARDLDVMRTGILQPLADSGETFDAIVAERLIARTEQEIAVVRAAVRADLSEAGVGVPMLSLARALHALPAASSDVDLPTLARRALRRARRRVAKRLEAAESGQDGARLHSLRIACKRLRYISDALLAVRGKKRTTRQERLARVQKELGYLNDLRTTQATLADWAQDDVPMLEARAYLLGWHAHCAAQARRNALNLLRKITD
ncbi:CHAD domain-containing protein [Uliginosibacterium sp. sgz301328]|uniref:CYTH and CHAD domain-containing protein n=1 Tax=Uliginosibacterium sp. sgz301328 TaxID=3243764 RepID=UPI00359EDC75